jgi:DNA polymerase sigma
MAACFSSKQEGQSSISSTTPKKKKKKERKKEGRKKEKEGKKERKEERKKRKESGCCTCPSLPFTDTVLALQFSDSASKTFGPLDLLFFIFISNSAFLQFFWMKEMVDPCCLPV